MSNFPLKKYESFQKSLQKTFQKSFENLSKILPKFLQNILKIPQNSFKIPLKFP